MFAQVKATGDMVEVLPLTVVDTAGTKQLFREVTLTSNYRTFTAEELDFNPPKTEMPETPLAFNTFDWRAFGCETARMLLIEKFRQKNYITATDIENVTKDAALLVDELKKRVF